MVPELTVTDFPASLNFYTNVLGFSVMIRRTEPNFAYVCLGEAQLMLEQYHPGGWNTAELTRPLGRGVNFQIEVDDIKQMFDRVSAHGVTLYRVSATTSTAQEKRPPASESFLCRIRMATFCVSASTLSSAPMVLR